MAKKYIDSQAVIDNLDTNGDELTDKSKRLEVINKCGLTQRLQEVLITPAMATGLLRLNHGTRVRHGNKEKMKFDMTHGLWGTCDSMIMFSPNGNLVNGKMILEAIQESGIAQRLVVMTGVVPHVEIDTGANRTPFEVITMYRIGGSNYDAIRTQKVISAIGSMLRRKCRHGMRIENSDYCRLFETYKDTLLELRDVLNTYQGDAYINAALIAARLDGVDIGDISSFKAAYCKMGRSLNVDDAPVNVFWDYYHEILSGCSTNHFKDKKFAATQTALYAYLNQTTMTKKDYMHSSSKAIHDYDITWLNQTINGGYDSTKFHL